MDDDELNALLAAEAEHAEAMETGVDDGLPLPPHVTVSRPNLSR